MGFFSKPKARKPRDDRKSPIAPLPPGPEIPAGCKVEIELPDGEGGPVFEGVGGDLDALEVCFVGPGGRHCGKAAEGEAPIARACGVKPKGAKVK